MYRFLGFSTADAPDIAAVVFSKGCNLRCSYCYNLDLLNEEFQEGDLSLNEIIEKIGLLQKRQIDTGQIYNTVDWLILSGGEPFYGDANHLKEINQIIEKALVLNLKIGVYTNGLANFSELETLIRKRSINMVHLDVKDIKQEYIDIIEKLYAYKVDESLDYLQLNTTIRHSLHTKEYLLEMKSPIEKIVKYKFNFTPIKKFQKRFGWSLTPFYNNNDRIQTWGKLKYQDEMYTTPEWNHLFT